MDVKILDSHLREFVTTSATPEDIAKAVSLTSASIEKIEPFGDDFLYNIEITTNRPDMANVLGLARETAAVLPQFGFDATFVPLKITTQKSHKELGEPISVKNDNTLVRRICTVAMDITMGESPEFIKKRLEAAGIRILNNVVDITNYVMLEVGHPTHVFDLDRLTTKKLVIRESKKNEKIVTLDKKEYTLAGGDIVADDGTGQIVDLLGVMGTLNSVVTNQTKRILFFIDNNDPWKMRKTSMGLGIRTEAATLNEKGIDVELALIALQRGMDLYHTYCSAKIISDILDIYPHLFTPTTVTVHIEKISTLIGVHVPTETTIKILKSLGFDVKRNLAVLEVKVPSWREKDITIEEDVIEEVARVYGYYNLPSLLPPYQKASPYHQETNAFFWEKKAKEAMKYWGYTETYTYSMVSETLFEGPLSEAITLKNPLDEDHTYLRKTLTPSLLQVLEENKGRENVAIFEIANTYHIQANDLPNEVRMLAIVMKGIDANFAHIKGVVDQLVCEFGINELIYTDLSKGGLGADIYLGKNLFAQIEILEENIVSSEINFDILTKFATLKKTYLPLAKYPGIQEDMTIVTEESVKTGDIVKEIKKQSTLIAAVNLTDIYQNARTFHIVYQDKNKNLTTPEVITLREKIIKNLETKLNAQIK